MPKGPWQALTVKTTLRKKGQNRWKPLFQPQVFLSGKKGGKSGKRTGFSTHGSVANAAILQGQNLAFRLTILFVPKAFCAASAAI
jgi:hypothetical protein